MKTKNDVTVKEIRELSGLSKRTHETLESIVKKIQPRTFEPVGERVCLDPEYLSEDYRPLD